MSFAVSDRKKQLECLQRCLRLNPGNRRAQSRLKQLRQGSPDTPVAGTMRAGASAARAGPPRRRRPEEAGGLMPSRREGEGLSVRMKALIAGGGLVLLLAGAAGAYFFLSYLLGTFGEQRAIASTAQAATQIARATSGAAIGLPPTWTPTTTPTREPSPTITPTPTHTPTPTPVPPDPVTLAEMEEIQQEVADIRGLEVVGTSSSYVINSVKVRPILEASFRAGGGSEAEVEDLAHSLSALGLIKPTYDLYTNILNGLTDSLGGFYLPWSGEIFVIGGRFSGVERWVYSHEYGHALVDAHFDIGSAGVYPLCELNQDKCNAIQALVEGDATLVMTQWWQQYADPQDYQDILNYTPPHRTLPDEYPPPYSLPDSNFPYDRGLGFVQFLYNRGNWAEVNTAYDRYPESTEQILHPGKYLANEQPQEVTVPDLAGVLGQDWHQIESDTLGEWMTYLLLGYGADLASQVDLSVAETAAAGWGGDRYVVFRRGSTDDTVLAARWRWDTTGDAAEYARALRSAQDGRYRGGTVPMSRGDCWEANAITSCVLTSDGETLWLQAPAGDLMEGLFTAFPGFD